MRPTLQRTAQLAAMLMALNLAPALAQSQPFTLSFDQSQYAVRQPIVIQTTCPAESSSAWVGLFKADASSQSYLDYKYVNSEPGCRLEFDGRDNAGAYEARYFPDGGYDELLRVPFAVVTETAEASAEPKQASQTGKDNGSQVAAASTSSVMTESGIAFGKAGYRTGETIHVTTDCSRHEKDGWIGIFSPSDSARDYGTYKADWLYIRDRQDCRFAFSARSHPGTYEVRVIPPSGDYIAVRQAFEVTAGQSAANAPKLVRADYKTLETIEVTTPCATGASAGSDWIAVFKAGVSSYSYGSQGKDWFYMKQGPAQGRALPLQLCRPNGDREVRSPAVPRQRLHTLCPGRLRDRQNRCSA